MTRSGQPTPGGPPGGPGKPPDGSADPRESRVVPWPGATEGVRRRGAPPPARYCYLLDADTDLAEAFDLRMRVVVRQVATALVRDVAVGTGCFATSACDGLGCLVLDGLFVHEVHVGGRTSAELLGPGDLLRPPHHDLDELFERELMERALVPARVAVLDTGFLDRTRPWPEVVIALLHRADKRATGLNVNRAVCSHPSLELRLALLMWNLAERWGRVEPGGVRLELPLTHSLLGHLVAAERPSVSRSLSRLAEHDLVSGHSGDWHLHGSAEVCMKALGTRMDRRATHTLLDGSSR